MDEGFFRPSEGGILLNLRVSPGAKTSCLAGFYGRDALRLKVAAPPVGGKANAEARRFLAERFGVPRSRVEVVRGATSRDKTVLVRGVAPEEARKALQNRP